MSSETAVTMDLKIDRNLQNNKFNNWRLGKDFLLERHAVTLPGSIAVVDTDAVDYVRTRTSVLHNHLFHSQGRMFFFLKNNDSAGAVQLFEVLHAPDSQPPVLLHCMAELPPVPGLPGQPQLEARLEYSVTAVSQPGTGGHSSPPAGSTLSTQPFAGVLVVSLGCGDVRLIHCVSGAAAHVGAVMYPLRPPAPLSGVRPCKVEAAYTNADGRLRCILSAISDKTDHRKASTEVFAVTLTPPTHPSAPTAHTEGGLEGPNQPPAITDVQLLVRSALPPHSVVVCPSQDGVLMGIDPTGMTDVNMTGHTHHAQPVDTSGSAAGGSAAQTQTQPQAQAQAQQRPGLGSQPVATEVSQTETAAMEVDADLEHIECRKPGLGAVQQGDTASGMDEDSDDMDPRTLAEAAARLAKYTSDQPVGDLPHQQWADLYKESGPEDVNSDIVCEFVGVKVKVEAGDCGGSGAQGAGDVPQAPVWALSCGPHRVLAADTVGACTVSDDVDGCVLQLQWAEGAPVPQVEHVRTIPALAYIIAGKTQRKHLLTGSGAAGVAAVLVEGTRFYYVYGEVSVEAQNGLQQVVDMDLESEERVQGARMVVGHTASGKACELLLIATQSRLLVHVMSGM